MGFRAYEPDRDEDAVHRIWREVGWLAKKEEVLDIFVSAGRAMVAEAGGNAECLVLTEPGTMRYLDTDLPFCAVTSVTTSRIARKQGLAKRLAAEVVALDAAGGAVVAGLSTFEQGFYDQIGFGMGGYEHRVRFDPAWLRVDAPCRMPARLTADDWAIAHEARLQRLRAHGSVNLLPPEFTRAEMAWAHNGFGLGYRDGNDGSLSHYVWCSTKDVGKGPYRVDWMVYRTYDQFLELLGLLKTLGDQVFLISMLEPTGVQMQDLLVQPFKQRAVREKSPFETGIRASAWGQERICDLEACLASMKLSGDTVRFNLCLTDPIEAYLKGTTSWRGVGGDYVITAGPSSGAERGHDKDLATLTASVNAFTRLWLGVRPATGLAVTDDLSGPKELLEELDWVFRLPAPHYDWLF